MIKKTIQRSDDLFVQFTTEEMSALNIKPGDKFSWKAEGDSILLQKYGSIDLDLSELSRETLEMLITDSVNKDISVNEVIEQILEQHLTNCNE
jgi:bifunctional DNA-binding transcriptional regulator/antitoxin component of YhaV-PrlF toxin-antitoxin module